VDDVKLAQFSLRCPIHPDRRILIWKILLKVLPRFQSNHDYCWKIKSEMFRQAQTCALAMKTITPDTPEYIQFLKIHLISDASLNRLRGDDIENQPDCQHFIEIAKVFSEISDSEEEAYWLSRNFFNLSKKYHDRLPGLIDSVETVLEKEDSELHKHLTAIRGLDDLPYNEWFYRCFAGFLPVPSLLRIWDRIIGGSIKILMYVVVAMLLSLRDHAKRKVTNSKEVLIEIKKMFADVGACKDIVQKATQLWLNNASRMGLV